MRAKVRRSFKLDDRWVGKGEILDLPSSNRVTALFAQGYLEVPGKSKPAKPQKINLNEATKEELQKLNGVGSYRAAEIQSYRPFLSLQDAIAVMGYLEDHQSKLEI